MIPGNSSRAVFQHFLDAVSFNDIIVQGSKITVHVPKGQGCFSEVISGPFEP